MHIWLLHHLFLPAIRTDAAEWVETWNTHKITGTRESECSPLEMFFLGMVEHGARGLDRFAGVDSADIEPLEDPVDFGIDYEALHNTTIMNQHHAANPTEQSNGSFIQDNTPQHFSNVPCEPPNCPFAPEDVEILDQCLADIFPLDILKSRSMRDRTAIWDKALELCEELRVLLQTS